MQRAHHPRRPSPIQTRAAAATVLKALLTVTLLQQSACGGCNGEFTLSFGLGSHCPVVQAPRLVPDSSSLTLAPNSSASLSVVVGGASGQTFVVTIAQQSPGLLIAGGATTVPADGRVGLTITANPLAALGAQLSFEVEAKDGKDPKLSNKVRIAVHVVAPFGLVPLIVAGTAGTTFQGDVAVQRFGGFTGPVHLQVTGLPPGWSATSPVGTTALLPFSITAPASAAPQPYSATITGTDGGFGGFGTTRTAPLTVNLAGGAPDFSLSASPAALAITQGQSATTAISIAPTAAGLGNVTLTLLGAPAGVTGTFNPPSAGSASTLTIDVAPGATPGTYTALSVVGTAGPLLRSLPFSLTIAAAPDFTMSVAPAAITVTAGTQGAAVLTVARTGAVGAIDLDYTGNPAGMTLAFASDPVTGTTTGATILTSAATPPGTHVVTLSGLSGGLTRTTTLTVTVNAPPPPAHNFGVQLAVDSVTLAPGAMVTVPVSLPRTGQLVGASVILTSFFPSVQGFAWVSPNPSIATTATLQVVATTVIPPGVYHVPVTGAFNSGSIIRADTLVVTVVPSAVQDFSLWPTPTVVILTRGGMSRTAGLDIRRTNGFPGAVAFSDVGAAALGITINFAPQVAGATVNGTLATFYAAPNATPGFHAITLRGVSGTLTRDLVITVIVN